MIVWLAPAALAGMALLAGPFVVHLLARRNARRVIFPATQFVRATQAAAVRLRRPSDIALLIVRLAIVAAAVLAAAQPLLVTRWTLSGWNARVSRAIVVDTTAGGPDAQRLRQLADQEAGSAFRSARIDTVDLRDGLARAAQWLAASPPSRREVVVLSDFRRDAIDRGSLAILPAQAGVRFVRGGAGPRPEAVELPAIDAWRGGRWQPTVTAEPDSTRTSWMRVTSGPPVADWLTVTAAPADAAMAERARRAALSFGIPPGDDTHKVVVAFAGGEPRSGAGQPVQVPWMAAAAQSLRSSSLLHDIDVEASVTDRAGVLVVGAPVTASSPGAAAIVRAAMLAVRPAAIAGRALETAVIPDAELSAWRRDAAPVAQPSAQDLRSATEIGSDARWLWAVALALLGVESWMRRSARRTRVGEAHANAA